MDILSYKLAKEANEKVDVLQVRVEEHEKTIENFSFIMTEPNGGYFRKPGIFYYENHAAGGYVGLVVTRSGYANRIQWTGRTFYGAGTRVFYGDNVYVATQDITTGDIPPTHIDSNVVNGWAYVGVKAEFKPYGYISM